MKNIEITLEEEATLVMVFRHIGGNPNTTARKHTDRVLSLLDHDRFKDLGSDDTIKSSSASTYFLEGSLEAVADATRSLDLSKAGDDELTSEMVRRGFGVITKFMLKMKDEYPTVLTKDDIGKYFLLSGYPFSKTGEARLESIRRSTTKELYAFRLPDGTSQLINKTTMNNSSTNCVAQRV